MPVEVGSGVGLVEDRKVEGNEGNRRSLLFVGHTYQPPREFLDLSDFTGKKRADIVSWVNKQIYQQCYKPIFVDREQLPHGLIFSLYGTLREWVKGNYPEAFGQIVYHIQQLPKKEYCVLGDSYLHPILPLQSEENQEMMVKIGRKAFEEDLGFIPKGFWLPETAVSKTTMRVLFDNGYEFIVLRDNQLQSKDQNPMYVPIKKDDTQIGRLAAIHLNSGLSAAVSFNNGATIRGEDFLNNPWFSDKRPYVIGTDTELYGHHRPDKDKFLCHVTRPEVLSQHGFAAFDVKKALEETQAKPSYTDIWENSSWSCPHNLGRWTGNCCCDTSDKKIIDEKKHIFDTISTYGTLLDQRLDAIDPSWREQFVDFFLGVRRSMYYDGEINKDIEKLQGKLPILRDGKVITLFKAQLARFTGETSCFGFFGGENRPEREIARTNIGAIHTLLRDTL